jgi:ribosomal protein S18 acetylase RimI-like enzyme
MPRNFVFAGYEREFGFELLKLWRQSFARAIGFEEDTSLEAVQIHLDVLKSIDPAFIRVALDVDSSAIAGFMTLEKSYIQHLFVHVNHQGQGLGSQFIEQAKDENEHLSLHTFQLNKRAQTFYGRHNFIVTKRSFAAPEENPWATMREQLADIQYEWSVDQRGA